jgi:hypothetical protein
MDVNGNMLSVDIKEENPRTMYYTYDGGKTKNPISKLKQTIDMGITTPGTYKVQVYVDDYFDLSNTASEITTIVETPTGTKELSQAKYLAYPNPVKDQLTLKYPENSYATITLNNLAGQTLEQKIDNDQDGQTTIDMSNYASAAYLYTISITENYVNKNPTIETGKIIKK